MRPNNTRKEKGNEKENDELLEHKGRTVWSQLIKIEVQMHLYTNATLWKKN